MTCPYKSFFPDCLFISTTLSSSSAFAESYKNVTQIFIQCHAKMMLKEWTGRCLVVLTGSYYQEKQSTNLTNRESLDQINQSSFLDPLVHFSGRHIQTNGIRPNFDLRVLDEQNYENNNSIITLNRKNWIHYDKLQYQYCLTRWKTMYLPWPVILHSQMHSCSVDWLS